MESGKPPAFGAQEYWESRFRENTDPYDWLQPATILDKDITEALMLSDDPGPQILHVGSGTSLLSFHLRSHVDDPGQIQNVDYSSEAIKWGQQREREIFNFQLDEDDFESEEEDQDEEEVEELRKNAMLVGEIPMMRWSQTSLLSLPSVITTCQLGAFSVIVDKSLCDAIACSENIDASLYFGLYCPTGKAPALSTVKEGDEGPSLGQTHRVHPLHVLGLNLALLARTGARWIALSYSEQRFPFLHGKGYQPRTSEGQFDNSLPKALLDQGFPDPGKLWFQIRKDAVNADGEQCKKGEDGVFRPEPKHWIYVLERTPVELRVLSKFGYLNHRIPIVGHSQSQRVSFERDNSLSTPRYRQQMTTSTETFVWAEIPRRVNSSATSFEQSCEQADNRNINFLGLNKSATMTFRTCDSKERNYDEPSSMKSSKVMLLEAGLLEAGIPEAEVELQEQPNNHMGSSETNRNPDDCGKCIMFWTPILGFLFLCTMGLLALGLKAVMLLFGHG